MSYPPSEFWNVETITVPATAGNVAYNLSPSAGYRYIILYGRITIVADANPANRVFYLSVTDSSANILGGLYKSTPAITAGQTKNLNIQNSLVTTGAGAAGYGDFHFSIGYPLIIDGTNRLTLTVAAGLAGDSYSGYITVLKIKM